MVLLLLGGGACAPTKDAEPPLDAFLREAFTGEEGALAAAVVKYGDSSLLSEELSVFLLSNPIVEDTLDNADGTVCYTLRVEAGITQRRYKVCWEGERLVSVEDEGMILDE